jgi:outer membrane protein TolC
MIHWLLLATALALDPQQAAPSADPPPSAESATPSAPHLQLDELVAAASEHYPRRREIELRAGIADRRLANLDARFRPSLDLQGAAAYHSEVARLPVGNVAGPPHDQYSVFVGADQRLWDGGRTRQEKAIEQAGRDLDQQQIEVDFFAVRERLEGAYFAALLSEKEIDLIATLEADFEAQLGLAESRVEAGVALPGDAAVLAAELEEQRQRRVQAAGERRAALAVLGALAGRELPDESVLALPAASAPADLGAAARAAAAGSGVGRPEIEALARGRRLLAEQRALTGLAGKPTVSAFAQGGLGRPPDQNFLERDLTPFAVLGLRLRWQPFDWGVAAREAEVRGLEAEVSQAREQAFLESLSASLEGIARRIEALRSVVSADDRIVELRQSTSRQVEAQLREGVITPADYLVERNAEHRARLTRERHRLELARDTVDFLTTLGVSR